ncbi:histidinol dehydrogenase [Candidatus Formimonas warabiya]|uniref:Histidinol dehydrogenase n=1 Tax=Formimonas warabiya TaxID=1761012 RepID=A0A3G1KR75_FORW1|nr:histidinol dehydrogenase [Candidatus Formimonas warabiya]ATW24961.1 histidinol dehydrogenase [Candidatus Formimonas warabiya]
MVLVLKDNLLDTAWKQDHVQEIVLNILNQVKNEGDKAVLELTKRYDGVDLEEIQVPKTELKKAYSQVSPETVKALEFAAEQIRFFAEKQMSCLQPVECSHIAGVTLGSRLVPIQTCGAYVPAGRYPLPSTALMSVIPAKVAGVERVAACSPPSKGYDRIHPAVLVGLDIAGVDDVYCMGGAQAIAAYAFGTASVPKVDVIVGPGNRFVTEAKRQVNGMVGIDMLAGPSEVLIIADETASPVSVAVDLLAKCEHDSASIAILLTTSRELAEQVEEEIENELKTLGTAALARKTWEENGKIVLVDSLDEAVAESDQFAPEHLQLMTAHHDELALKLRNFGSLFIGHSAPVAFGDYVSGTNHTLPTMQTARFSNGVWVGTFLKMSSYQVVTAEGAAVLAGPCAHLAGVEGLLAHQRSAQLRMKK